MTTNHDRTLGTCAACRSTVILIVEGLSGTRYCCGCERVGPDVTLVSELPDTLDVDDVTHVDEAPLALLAATRRGAIP